MNRVHIALPVAHLGDSVRFYTTLLGREPARRFAEYAQFLLDDPNLNLALTAADGNKLDRGGHFGIEVSALEDVEAARRRVQAAGADVDVDVEADTVCCHSRQTKVWVVDPDGRRWEVFHVAERESRALGAMPSAACCPESCCSTSPRSEAVPLR